MRRKIVPNLVQLENVGYNQEFFHLKAQEDHRIPFKYYIFDVHWPREFISYWDITGLRCKSEKPFLCDVRLIHIEEEMLDQPDFEAVHDASGYISFDPQQFLDIIRFFEKLVDVQPVNISLNHFHLMSAEALARIHYPQPLIASMVGRCYYYLCK
jgi:hypothetical protein